MNRFALSLPRSLRATARRTRLPLLYSPFHLDHRPRVGSQLWNPKQPANIQCSSLPNVNRNVPRSVRHNSWTSQAQDGVTIPEEEYRSDPEARFRTARKRVGRKLETKKHFEQLMRANYGVGWMPSATDADRSNRATWEQATDLRKKAEEEHGGFEKLMTTIYSEGWVDVLEVQRVEEYNERIRKFEDGMKAKFGDAWKQHDRRTKAWFHP
ncbi:uncharacterized protein BCR38DRAFT_117437 [Pseudomassariella vexata]|uniref:Uncharacterized protein n=1 Tax=Pseudomassariella vexata TaxID=1141098 RepID=A0A1Y2DB33_9PEZI|nr:uncharacterized protein BCR38DRAFT_117437 [Pseudomassariella vexata]ORY56326.1 hypothetical protein BCR38DRAFT_117437 [Pseudomassariella vexata]